MPKNLLYVRSGLPVIGDEELAEIQRDAQCQISCCVSCECLIERLSILSKYNTLPDCIAIDSCFLRNTDFAISEIICMVTTFCRSLSKSKNISIAVVLDGSCCSQEVKDMQSNSDITGMIPAPSLCGKEATVTAINQVLDHHRHWPVILSVVMAATEEMVVTEEMAATVNRELLALQVRLVLKVIAPPILVQ